VGVTVSISVVMTVTVLVNVGGRFWMYPITSSLVVLVSIYEQLDRN